MGKDKNVVCGVYGASAEHTIKRSDFKAAIEHGIAAAQQTDRDYPLPINELRRAAATETTMDACTWKNKDSCGCPMTFAGVVIVIDDEEGDEKPIASAPAAFAGAYDDSILQALTNYAGGNEDDWVGEDPMILNIVED